MDERATNLPAITIRRMHDAEEGSARALAGRAFPPLGNFSFSPPPHTLLAEQDGRLIGAVVPEIFELPGKRWDEDRRGGVMLWLMTDPEARGSGVGRHLVEAALRFFEERGCQEVFACVEGFNTSSSNIFASHGFKILPLGEQLRRYGLFGTSLLWFRTYRFGGDVGHFLWARPGATRPDRPALQWWVGTLVNALIFLLAGWRGGWIAGFDPLTVLGGTAVIFTLFSLREVAMRLTAYGEGLSVRRRAWEAAFPLSFGVSLAFGFFLPAPGSAYPRGEAWRYRDLVPKLGPIAFVGTAAVLAFTWAAWALLTFGSPPTGVAVLWLRAAQAAGLQISLFEVLLPFSLFASFNGRRVWDWNRAAWLVLAVAATGLLLVEA